MSATILYIEDMVENRLSMFFHLDDLDNSDFVEIMSNIGVYDYTEADFTYDDDSCAYWTSDKRFKIYDTYLDEDGLVLIAMKVVEPLGDDVP